MTYDYWGETMSEACEEAALPATKEQINTLASWAEGAHDNYSQARGYDVCYPATVLESDHKSKVKALEADAADDLRRRDEIERELRWQIRRLESDNDRLRSELRSARS